MRDKKQSVGREKKLDVWCGFNAGNDTLRSTADLFFFSFEFLFKFLLILFYLVSWYGETQGSYVHYSKL